jgi:hypothetical protein
MRIEWTDLEVRDFVDALRAAGTVGTHSGLADEVRGRFGRMRAWSAESIAAYTREAGPIPPSKYRRDAELVAFINDRLGLLSVSEVRRQALAKFGADRTPSRSQMHRLIGILYAAAVQASSFPTRTFPPG